MDIKRFLTKLADKLEYEAPFDAQNLRKISTHWLRHTFASMLVKTTAAGTSTRYAWPCQYQHDQPLPRN